MTYAISQVGDLTIFKYNDANASGSYDVGDSPLANWQFTVSGVPGTFATGASGLVTVPDLTPGPYTVTENLKSGWQCTDPGASLKKVVAVTSGETTNVLFGNYLPTGDLIIYKYNDEEGDGEYNGDEPLLDGWKFNINGPIDLTGITSGGYVVFGNVPIGQYWVMETLQDGWCNTDPRGPWYGKLLQVNENQTTHVYFGNQQTGSIRIFKYNDLLGDGQFNGADFGLHGWHFRVSGRLVNFITDADGYVTVTNLVPGLHTVSEVLPIPPYWICTDPGLSRQKEVLVEPNATVYVMFGNHEGEHLVPILGDWGIVALSTAFVSLLAWFGMRKRRTAQRQ